MKRLLSTLAMGVVLTSVIVFSIRADEDSGTDCPQASGSENCSDGKQPCGLAIELDLDLDGKSAADKDKSHHGCCEGHGADLCTESSSATKCATGTDKCCAEVTDAGNCCADAKRPCPVDETAKPAHRRKVCDGEAAKVLIEILDRLGPSALEGTAFDVENCSPIDAAGGERRSIRQQLVECVGHLEAEDACLNRHGIEHCNDEVAQPVVCDIAGEPPCRPGQVNPYSVPILGPHAIPPQAYGPPPTVYYPAPYGGAAPAAQCESAKREASIAALRHAAETLERTAAELEQHNLYDSSDLTREMASHLRLEGRRLQRQECEAAEDKVEVRTTRHHGATGQAPRPKGTKQARYLGGVRVSK